MAHVKTAFNVVDTVWWVHCSGRVYRGTIQDISCCDYQGALYCHIHSPAFKRNPNPSVHYSVVFSSREGAIKFAEYQKANPDGVLPHCMGCHYKWNGG